MAKTKTSTSEISEASRVSEIRKILLEKRRQRREQLPLGLPKGSIRALITLVAMLGFAIACGYSMVADAEIPQALSTIVVTIVAFYFGTRAAGKEIDGNEIQVSGDFRGEIDDISGNKNLSK